MDEKETELELDGDSWNRLEERMRKLAQTHGKTEEEFEKLWNEFVEGMERAARLGVSWLAALQAQLEAKLKEPHEPPERQRARDLVREAEELLWKKQYDECIQKMSEAAALDPIYAPRVEEAEGYISKELRKGPVRLTRAVNRILYPRLRELGFRHQSGEDSAKWKDGTIQVRTDSRGRECFVYMGRTKFGKRFGLDVWKKSSNGKVEVLDLSTVGLDDDSLCYQNQEEANAMLERIAVAFEGPILAWMEEEE